MATFRAEIAQLMKMRESPATARASVRKLTERKLADVEARLGELTALRNELSLLLSLCGGVKDRIRQWVLGTHGNGSRQIETGEVTESSVSVSASRVSPMEQCATRVVHHRRREGALIVDALLTWLDSLLVTLPGKIAELLEECQAAGWITIDNGELHLAAAGQQQIQTADATSYSKVHGASTTRWRLVCNEYIRAETSLSTLLDEADPLRGIPPPISATTLEGLVEPEGTGGCSRGGTGAFNESAGMGQA